MKDKNGRFISVDPVSVFWKSIEVRDIDSCWNWIGSYKDKRGRGHIFFKGKKIISSRFSWELFYGEIPLGMCVCHTCDNPSCCNPKHLWIGTQIDNIKDRDKKGRQGRSGPGNPARGERSGKSKLTYSQVKEIIIERNTNNTFYYILAERYNVSRAAVQAIVNGKTWRHVKT